MLTPLLVVSWLSFSPVDTSTVPEQPSQSEPEPERELPDIQPEPVAEEEPRSEVVPQPAPEPPVEPGPMLVPVMPPLPPPPPPPDGSGRLVGGSVSLALGLGAFAVVAYEAGREDGNPAFVAGTFVPLGLAALGVGTYLLIRGAKARANFLDWRSFAGQRGRPSGSGLVVGGTMSLVIGGVTMVAAAVESSDPDNGDPVLATSLWSVGGAAALAGVLQLTFGVLRRNQYRVWRQRTFLTPVVMTRPTRPGQLVGAGIGLSGSF
ncbi:MAG: hypothetical protein KC457_17340 [Myxococcales bacterium]|nr:hypothetical protein [Myxococcales bacterium]